MLERKMRDETIIYVTTPRVACSGENNDHPKVWYTVPEVGEGYVVCGYCCLLYTSDAADE